MSIKHTLVRPTTPATFTVAVDPGGSYAGVAVFQGRDLVHGAKAEIEKRRDLCNQAEALANAIFQEAFSAMNPLPPTRPITVHVLCEGQQTRKAKNQKGDQNVLIHLAVNSGFILAKLKAHLGAEAFWVPPTSWKGTIDKNTKLKQIRSTLTEEELAETAKNEHTMDAAGIGLWWLGRMR